MNETNPTDFVISDLTPQRYWQQQPTVDESAWLERIAVLPTEPFLLATGLGLGASSDEPVLHRDVDGWRAGRFIGEIHHAGRTLKILPRLGLETLTAWISAIYNVKVIPHAAGRGTPTAPLVIQLAAAMWRAAVLDAGKHALPRVKVDQVQHGLQVRGRLDVAGTARARLRGVREVASVDRRRSLTNPAVTSVVSADRILDRHLESSHWRGQRIEEQLVAMRAAVGSHPELPKRHDLRRMRYSPITAKWRRAAELSHMIASSELFKHSPTAETTHGLLIDVAELWELFLTACAARATEATIVHGTRTDSDRALLTSFTEPGRVLGRLYPDIIINQNGNGNGDERTVVVDAKYKPLIDPRGVDREDLYQIYAYAQAWNAERALLAYPRIDQPNSAAEEHGPWRGANESIFTFERIPTVEAECIKWFQRWLRQPQRTP